jgi:hypothetical protein
MCGRFTVKATWSSLPKGLMVRRAIDLYSRRQVREWTLIASVNGRGGHAGGASVSLTAIPVSTHIGHEAV